MGGRGSFDFTTNSIPLENRQYVYLDSFNGIKIIKGITIKNGKPPVMSNTANTAYAVWSDTAARIKHILFYRDHILYKAIDIEGEDSHWHNVSIDSATGVIGRTTHNRKNTFEPSSSEWKLVKALEKWKIK
ncbi:MAG: hypothetical protein ACI4AM_02360 [Muribaculaceae bacterium]